MDDNTVSRPGPPRRRTLIAHGVIRGRFRVVQRAIEELELVRVGNVIQLMPREDAEAYRANLRAVAFKHMQQGHGAKEMVA